MDRVKHLSAHLSANPVSGATKPDELFAMRLDPMKILESVRPKPDFDIKKLTEWIDFDNHEMRSELRTFLKNEIFVSRYHDKLEDMRTLATARLAKICENPGRFVSVHDFKNNPERIFAAHELTCLVDGSLATKLTVQFNLFGGTVLKLGTERHHKVLEKIDSFEQCGCFALTEVSVGNNAIRMGTTATFDPKTKEFVINTPTPMAQKYWITNGAIDAHWSVVFAQTLVDGENEGVNAFLVRIRDDERKTMPNVEIYDMGRKMGQNGVDNAKLKFNNVRVPQAMMLNRVADVDENGKLVSAVKSKRGRFIAALNQLMSGRLCLSSKGVGRAKQALAIAVRYSATRLSVGISGESDTPILDYQLQRRALIPLIARTYAVSVVGMSYVKRRFQSETTCAPDGLGDLSPELQVLCSAIKALNTWHCERTVSICRERCGGAGYLASSKFEEMLGDAHAICTAEGDNKVLMQKCAKERLSWARTGLMGFAKLNQKFEGFEDFRDLGYLEFLFKQREAKLIVDLQGNLDSDMKRGAPLFEVWMKRQSDNVQALAVAYTERVVLEQFILRISSAEKSLKFSLENLAVLYACDVIERDLAFFLTSGILSPNTEISKVCKELCGGYLADQALNLVDAFAIPDYLLAPPALDWVSYQDNQDNQGELIGVRWGQEE